MSETANGTKAPKKHRDGDAEDKAVMSRKPPEQRQPGAPEAEPANGGARYANQSYGDAGGETAPHTPKHPSERWKDQGGAGEGEAYGTGHAPAAGRSAKRP